MHRFLRLAILTLAFTSTLTAAGTQATKKKKTSDVQESTAKPGPAIPAPNNNRASKIHGTSTNETDVVAKPRPIPVGPPVELQLKRASSRKFDLRSLPRTRPIRQDRVELPEPVFHPVTVEGTIAPPTPEDPVGPPTPSFPAPAPLNVFEGLDRFNWGAGSPAGTNGDAGPNEFIQTVNTSIGVFRKSDGFQEAAFTFNTFMSQGDFGNLCDTNNFGDPVVLYDTFDDRWIITDFAFVTDVSGNVLAPAYQCFAASMTGDPVAGGWNFCGIL